MAPRAEIGKAGKFLMFAFSPSKRKHKKTYFLLCFMAFSSGFAWF